MQMILLIKALSCSSGAPLERCVSVPFDPQSYFPPGRGPALVLTLTHSRFIEGGGGSWRKSSPRVSVL